MSSGSYGDSHLDVLNIGQEPVQTVKSTPLDSQYFGEGVSKADNEFIMMTYQNRKAFRFSSDLELMETMEMPSQIREGWGMTHNNQGELIVSDGSDQLFYVDPKTFTTTKQIGVTDNGKKIQRVNELELVKGMLYANVFGTNDLLVIDPDTGIV